MKKILTIVLASLLMIIQIPTTLAFNSPDPLSFNSIYSEANRLINIAVEQGIVPGQESGQMDALYLADSIPLYEVNGTNALVELSTIKYYPVLDQNDVARGLIIARQQDSNSTATLEYNDMFYAELTAYKQSSSNICFIFDQSNIYIFDGNVFSVVLQDTIPDLSRGIFSDADVELYQLECKQIAKKDQFDLLATYVSSTTGTLKVPLIDQDDWSNGCWAACSVSVGRYSGSGNLTIDDVMDLYADGKNVGKSIFTVQDVLAYEFGVETNQHIGAIKMTTVMDNIGTGTDKGDPILARVAYTALTEGHFIVIRGYTYTPGAKTNYVNIMDPLSHAYRLLPTEQGGSDSTFKYKTPTETTKYDINMYLTIS